MTTALITGASSGIGAEFARLLAKDGYQVVLVARREDRLEELANELRTLQQVEVEVIVADLGDPDGLERVAARCRSTHSPIELLINNAGYGAYGRFWDLDAQAQQHQINTNVSAVVVLTHAALQQMTLRKSGGIINLASILSFMPWPHHAVYAATKSFVCSFTESLSEELRGQHVHVMALCPGPTKSEFIEVLGDRMVSAPDFVWMTSKAVAKDAMRAYKRRSVVHISGIRNRIWVLPTKYAPGFLRRWAMGVGSKSLIHD